MIEEKILLNDINKLGLYAQVLEIMVGFNRYSKSGRDETTSFLDKRIVSIAEENDLSCQHALERIAREDRNIKHRLDR